MNDERPTPENVSPPRPPLEQRLKHRPDVLARLHELADTLDQSVTDDCTADAAEERVSAQVRQLAQELLGQWAREAEAHTQAQVTRQHPAAIHYGKKKTDVADDFWLGRGRGNAVAAGAARALAATVL